MSLITSYCTMRITRKCITSLPSINTTVFSIQMTEAPGLLCNYICETEIENSSAIFKVTQGLIRGHSSVLEKLLRRVEKPNMKIIKTVILEQELGT